MTLDDLAQLHRRVDHAGDDELSRLRRVHAAAAGADVGDRRDPEHPRGLRAAVGAGPDAGDLGPASPKYWHFVVEAKKLAFADLYAYNADPNFVAGAARSAAVEGARAVAVRPRRSESRVRRRRRARASTAAATPSCSRRRIADGNMVAWVNSLYIGFGSGLVVPGYGITLHNRGGLFTLDPKSPNVDRAAQAAVQHAVRRLRDAERPAADDGDADGRRHAGAGHRAGAASNVLDLGANVQAASDMARFRHTQVAERADARVAALRPRRRVSCRRWDTR